MNNHVHSAPQPKKEESREEPHTIKHTIMHNLNSFEKYTCTSTGGHSSGGRALTTKVRERPRFNPGWLPVFLSSLKNIPEPFHHVPMLDKTEERWDALAVRRSLRSLDMSRVHNAYTYYTTILIHTVGAHANVSLRSTSYNSLNDGTRRQLLSLSTLHPGTLVRVHKSFDLRAIKGTVYVR